MEIPVLERPPVNLGVFQLSHGGQLNQYLKQNPGMTKSVKDAFLNPSKNLKVETLNTVMRSALESPTLRSPNWRQFKYPDDSSSVMRFLSSNYPNPMDLEGQKSRFHIALTRGELPVLLMRKTPSDTAENTEFEGPMITWDPTGINRSVRITSTSGDEVSRSIRHYASKTLAYLATRDVLGSPGVI
jgi:hypothetical protein